MAVYKVISYSKIDISPRVHPRWEGKLPNGEIFAVFYHHREITLYVMRWNKTVTARPTFSRYLGENGPLTISEDEMRLLLQDHLDFSSAIKEK